MIMTSNSFEIVIVYFKQNNLEEVKSKIMKYDRLDKL
jgi:hypothetical protein